MNRTLYFSDLHLGVQRTGGTTLASAAELREYLHQKHVELMNLAPLHGCNRIVVNGDLTDTFSLPLSDALRIYEAVDQFMTAHPDIDVVHCTGNHDMSKDSSRMGTVTFIGALLAMKHPRFSVVSSPKTLQGSDIYVIPHCANSDLFSLELSKIPDESKWVFLHANVDNRFACDMDHSLNCTREQLKELKARGFKIVFGHEHQGRELLGGSVIVVGNPAPSSVSDCLSHGDGQKDGTKRAMVIDHDSGAHEYITTWTPDDADGWYAEVDWTDLKGIEEEGRGFVRVNGKASAAEAADVVKAISAFRQRSQSFVVTNAVQIEQLEGLEDITASIEDIRSVNVMDLLLEMLDPEQRAAIEKLTNQEAA